MRTRAPAREAPDEPRGGTSARAIRERQFDLDSLRGRGYAYERLDQVTMELLLGVP